MVYQLGKGGNLTRKETVDPLSKSILNACNVLAKMQLNSLSHYLQQPPFFWRELHALHLLAQQLDVADLDITNPMGINTSISKVYLKLLLFNCTSPITSPITSCALSTVNWISGPRWQSCSGAARGIFAVDFQQSRRSLRR